MTISLSFFSGGASPVRRGAVFSCEASLPSLTARD